VVTEDFAVPQLSEMEQRRADNIARNNAQLLSLGFSRYELQEAVKTIHGLKAIITAVNVDGTYNIHYTGAGDDDENVLPEFLKKFNNGPKKTSSRKPTWEMQLVPESAAAIKHGEVDASAIISGRTPRSTRSTKSFVDT
jgi:hypothetical protein